jgi:hypothetical protein
MNMEITIQPEVAESILEEQNDINDYFKQRLEYSVDNQESIDMEVSDEKAAHLLAPFFYEQIIDDLKDELEVDDVEEISFYELPEEDREDIVTAVKQEIIG